jgi:putative membrane protein
MLSSVPSFNGAFNLSDSTEDPFESGVHDVPISALCRSIEIDLRQALGQQDLPPPFEAVDDILY